MEDTINKDELAFLSKKILELNKQLIDSEKAKSRFLSLVACELNNPMTVLLGVIPHLKIQEDEQNRANYDLVYSEALKLDFRIENLVMAAEIESGHIDISYAHVSPKEIIDDAVESLKYVIKERNSEIIVIDTLSEKVVLDPKKICIIAKNLIANACQYGDENSPVEVILSVEDSTFTLVVKNRGEGPQINYKPEVFTRFANDMKGEHGLGIGLSIVRELCERFDGSIDYSVEEGFVTFTAKIALDEGIVESEAYGSNEFLFESFDNAIEI